jgi:hypothetical protein
MIRTVLMLAIAATLLAVTGCKSNTGSRQFIPGKGWVPSR